MTAGETVQTLRERVRARANETMTMTMTTRTTRDFRDDDGPVPASRHPNGGGWVADTAFVAMSAYVGPDAWVYGSAMVAPGARILDNARVYGSAKVEHDAIVCGGARVSGDARLSYGIRVGHNAIVSRTPVVVFGLREPVVICDNLIFLGDHAFDLPELERCSNELADTSIWKGVFPDLESIWGALPGLILIAKEYQR